MNDDYPFHPNRHLSLEELMFLTRVRERPGFLDEPRMQEAYDYLQRKIKLLWRMHEEGLI